MELELVMGKLRHLALSLTCLCYPAICQPALTSLVSSADLRTPDLVAGSLATAFCRGFVNFPVLAVGSGSPLPTNLAGVKVTVNGLSAPILAVASGENGMQQVNFQVPYEVTSRFGLSDPQFPLSIAIEFGGQAVYGYQFTGRSPGEFFWIGNQPAIFHSDFSLVTNDNPAKSGETLIVFAAGLTVTSPRVASGAAAPTTEPLARIVDQGYRLRVRQRFAYIPRILYQGLAPGLVGVYQTNFVLPDQYPEDRLSGEAELEIVRVCDNSTCLARSVSYFSKRVSFRIAPAN